MSALHFDKTFSEPNIRGPTSFLPSSLPLVRDASCIIKNIIKSSYTAIIKDLASRGKRVERCHHDCAAGRTEEPISRESHVALLSLSLSLPFPLSSLTAIISSLFFTVRATRDPLPNYRREDNHPDGPTASSLLPSLPRSSSPPPGGRLVLARERERQREREREGTLKRTL